MKVYITTRFKGAKENIEEIENLCTAVRNAGMEDFHFIRDVENYEHTFDNPRELWEVAMQKIIDCDALLIDISDSPSGGRLVEAGIAYAIHKPIIVIIKKGIEYKDFYEGIASYIVKYEDFNDITVELKNLIT